MSVPIIHWWYSHDEIHLSLQDSMTAVMLAHTFEHPECVETLKNSGAIFELPDKVSAVCDYFL